MYIPPDGCLKLAAVDRRSPVPLYHQVKEVMLSWISSGAFSTQQQFPSERDLENAFKVSRMTIRRALSELVEEGYLYREQGRGSFVARPRLEHQLGRLTSFTEDMKLRNLATDSIILNRTVVNDRDVAKRMGISDEDKFVRLDRIRLIGDQPAAIQATFVRHVLAPDLVDQELVEGSLYRTLEVIYGLEIGHAEQAIEAKPADEYEAEMLKVSRYSPVLALERLTFLRNGEPVEFVRSTFRGDRYRFVVALKR